MNCNLSHSKRCLLMLATLCICCFLLQHLYCIESTSSVGQSSGGASLRDRVRSLPVSESLNISSGPSALDLGRNYNNFSFFYRLSQAHMDAAMHWVDHQSTQLPLMRLSADEESVEYRAARAVKWLGTQSLAVVAAARNALPGLRTSVRNLRHLCSKFAHCSIVFMENDSQDDTRRYLYELTRSDPTVTLIGCGTLNSPDPCRLNVTYSTGKRHQPGSKMERSFQEEVDRGLVMSALRNQLLAYAYSRLADNHSLLLSIDPDLYWDPWDDQTLLQGLYYFSRRPRLDSLCASAYYYYWGRRTIYDPCTLDFHDRDTLGKVNRPATDTRRSAAVLSASWPVKVNSCFQGFTFYRMSSLHGGRLLYRKGHGEWICEHNTLSRQLRENYIDPNMQLRVRVGPFLL